uniref:Recep_L_domain domain-containing protein n=1 Tax=Elaeophora elaphi TaxID=1147741 RepID=A0A0R3RXR7_9BILA
MEFSVPSNYFHDMFVEDWNVSIVAFAKVAHTNERFYTQQILTLLKPMLFIEKFQITQKNSIASSTDEEQFRISVANSLNILLTSCEIKIDGTGLRFYDSPILCGLSIFRSIEPHNTLTLTTSAERMTTLTERKVVAVFNCDQLKNVRTYLVSNLSINY